MMSEKVAAEIHEIYPEFSPCMPVICALETLALTPEASPREGDGEVTKEQLAGWAKLYGRTPRNIRKWIALGRKAGDPCPIDDPVKMPAWWVRHMTWSVPDQITSAAAAASCPAPEAPSAPALPAPSSVISAQQPTELPINLSEFDLQQGEAVRQQRRIVGALYALLEKAYLGGMNADVIQQKYNKAVEALRKLEKDDRADQEAMGLLVPRAMYERDLANAGEMLKQMRESMERRVLELCPSLSSEQRGEVASAIRSQRAAEDRVFQRLHAVKTDDDLLAELAA